MAYAARVLDALGDPTRRQVFEIVARGRTSVAAIADQLPVSRPAVSQHLRVLKEARLVKDEAEGTRRYYELDRAGLEALSAYLDRFWDRALDRFKEAAEKAAKKGKSE